MAKKSKREYTDMWKKILTNHIDSRRTTIISSPPDRIKTLKRMISKEKDMDTDWKEKRYFKLVTTEVKNANNDVTGLEFKLVLFRERELVTSELLRTK